MSRDRALEEMRPSGHGRARGLLSSRSSGSRVDARSLAPPADLADVVESLWAGRWDLRGQEPHTSELIGDPAVHLVFEGGDRRESRVVGVWTRVWRRTLEGQGFVRAVKLRPGAGPALLPTPVGAFSNRVVPLADVVGEVGALESAVLDPADDEAGLLAVGDWVRGRVHRDGDIALAVSLVQRIVDSRLTRVDALSEVSGLGVRSLQRLFRSHVGASPKWVIRRCRLQEVALRVERGEAEDLADLAYTLGYADQAHLARDFRAVTGQTLRGFERRVHR